MTALRAAIAGGGIGGGTAALALQRRGFDVAVDEQAHQFSAGRVQTSASNPQYAALPLLITHPWMCDHDGKSVAQAAHV